MKVLISGFEPFNKSDLNPSELIVKELPEQIDDIEIVKVFLPVSYENSFAELKKEIDKNNPDVVICLGLANGRAAITIERVAINVNSASIADNDGVTYIDEVIDDAGENAYFSTLPIRKMMEHMNEAVPTMISNTAGTYVCNNIMYKVLHYVDESVQVGFIHVPMMTGMKNEKGFAEFELNDMTLAIQKGIESLIQ